MPAPIFVRSPAPCSSALPEPVPVPVPSSRTMPAKPTEKPVPFGMSNVPPPTPTLMIIPTFVADGMLEFQFVAVWRNVPPFRKSWRNVVPVCAPRAVVAPLTMLTSSTPPLTLMMPVKVLAPESTSLPAPVLVRLLTAFAKIGALIVRISAARSVRMTSSPALAGVMPVPPLIVVVEPPVRRMPPLIVSVAPVARAMSMAEAPLIFSVLVVAVACAVNPAVVSALEVAEIPVRVVPPACEARKFVSVP